MSAGAMSLMNRIMNSSVELKENADFDTARGRDNDKVSDGEISSFHSILSSLREKGETDSVEENINFVDELELDEEEIFSLLVILAGDDVEPEMNLEQDLFAGIDWENIGLENMNERELGKILAEIELENLDGEKIAEITGLEQHAVEEMLEKVETFQSDNEYSKQSETVSWQKFESMINQYDFSDGEELFQFLLERLEFAGLDADEISRLREKFSVGNEDDSQLSEILAEISADNNTDMRELIDMLQKDLPEASDIKAFDGEAISREELIYHLAEEYNLEREELDGIFNNADNDDLNGDELLNLLKLLDNNEFVKEENAAADSTAEAELLDIIENRDITGDKINQTSGQNNMQTFSDRLIEFLAEENNLEPQKIEEALAEIDLESIAEGKNYLQAAAEIAESVEAEISQLQLEESPARLAYQVWSEIAAEFDADAPEMDMNLQEFLHTLEAQPEDSANNLTEQDLSALETGNWQEIAASLLESNRDNFRDFQISGELRENSNPNDLELAAEEAIPAVESATGEESGLDLESLLLNSGQMNTTGTESAAGEAAANTQPAKLMDQVIDSIRVMQQQDQNSMSLELEPEFLGRINIDVAVENGEVIAHLLVENDFVRREMENNLNLLQRNLTREGFEIDQLTIESRDQESSLQYEQGSTDQRQQQDNYQGFRRDGQFHDEFQPEIAQRLSSLEKDSAGDVKSKLRNWLLWKQYQHTWV